MSLSQRSERRLLRAQLATLVAQVEKLSLARCFGTVASNDEKRDVDTMVAIDIRGFPPRREGHPSLHHVPSSPFDGFNERFPRSKALPSPFTRAAARTPPLTCRCRLVRRNLFDDSSSPSRLRGSRAYLNATRKSSHGGAAMATSTSPAYRKHPPLWQWLPQKTRF